VTVEDVKEEEEMPTIDEVNKNLDTTNTDIQGTGEAGVIEVIAPPPVEEVVKAPPPEPEPDVNIKPPEFPGGDKALVKWLSSHMEYPPIATRMGIQGIVIVEFTVDVKGKISDIAVVQNLHRACDNEAIRLIKAMPAWIPGESNGEKVVAKRKLPIPFVLN
jgi:periplasmic protein TonB